MRTVRLPFSHGQRVSHPSYPDLTLVVLSMAIDEADEWTISVSDMAGGGFWLFSMHELTPEHHSHQESLARWMGYSSAEKMNSAHDATHRWLAEALGRTSFSLQSADGRKLSLRQQHLAQLEEEAVLHLQRYMAHLHRGLPFEQ